MTSAPLVSLQAPKDVSLEEIEAELSQLWQNSYSDEGLSATRATTFSFLVYEPDETQSLLGKLGFYSEYPLIELVSLILKNLIYYKSNNYKNQRSNS